MTSRLLVPSSALLWGLQFALLSPALAIILSTLYSASTADIGWCLAVYNAGGFIASLVIPAWADRHRSYLQVMLASGAFTIALALALAAVTTLPLATVALVVLGGPAGLGSTMLFAHLRDGGASTSAITDTRALLSVAWMAGPPLATAIIGWAGGRGILAALVLIAVANIVTSAMMLRRHQRPDAVPDEAAGGADGRAVDGASAPLNGTPPSTPPPPRGRTTTLLVIAAFVLLQATNATAMTFMTLYVTQALDLPILWAGITLGVAAALEAPALMIVGRLGDRVPHLRIVGAGALLGVLYYAGLAGAAGPASLIALQIPNALSFAAISGVGMALFQDLIPGAGLSTGLFMNARRIGAIVSGPVIALAAVPALGQRGMFLVCAALTLAGFGLLLLARRAGRGPEAHAGRGIRSRAPASA